jgi:Ca2+-binding EF-hand superfamily protein
LALNTLSTSISSLEGDIEDQLRHTQKISANLEPLDQFLGIISGIDQQCEEANIEENDYTTYTYDELEYELSLVRNSVSKKLAFLENQMVARNMTNLTPIQLEEFESVFRHFDRDGSNSLQFSEFSAALASLGIAFDDEETYEKFLETSGGRDYVAFEQFIRFMVDVTEDQNTAEQVFESFREVADGKVSLYPVATWAMDPSYLWRMFDLCRFSSSPTLQNWTFVIPSFLTKSSMTWLRLCPSIRVRICNAIGICPSMTMSRSCNGIWATSDPPRRQATPMVNQKPDQQADDSDRSTMKLTSRWTRSGWQHTGVLHFVVCPFSLHFGRIRRGPAFCPNTSKYLYSIRHVHEAPGWAVSTTACPARAMDTIIALFAFLPVHGDEGRGPE